MKKEKRDMPQLAFKVIGGIIVLLYAWFPLKDAPALFFSTEESVVFANPAGETSSDQASTARSAGASSFSAPNQPAMQQAVSEPARQRSTSFFANASEPNINYGSSATRAGFFASRIPVFYASGPRPPSVNGHPVLYSQLKKICSCESSYSGKSWDEPRQFVNGKVVKNKTGTNDVGMCQINVPYHGVRSARLGYDIYTTDGNINYANLLFEEEGSTPWNSSGKCWQNSL